MSVLIEDPASAPVAPEKVTLTAKITPFLEFVLDGERHVVFQNDVQEISVTEDPRIAGTVLRVRAMEKAGWTAYVYGGVEIVFSDDGKKRILRFELLPAP